MFFKVEKILLFHKKIRHIRGGESTRKKYLNLALPSGFECIIGVLITMTDTFMISQFL